MNPTPAPHRRSTGARSAALPPSHAGIRPAEHANARAFAAAAVGLLLGATLLLGVGFSQPALLHAVAHDVRHATGFPCH